MMSSITASVGQAVAGRVRAEPDAVAEDVAAPDPGCPPDSTSVALAHEQRPDLGQAAPADDRARRRAEIDAALDQLRRRAM